MIYGSVCSGIEAATMAWHPLGWRPAFFSEIDPFPRAVLQHHYPDVPLHGDFTTIEADTYGAIDLLVGGTPCQSFSIAGLRGGLGDDRGNLALEYLRLADRLRPRWLVWENVPGVFSSLSHTSPDPCPPPTPVDMELDGQEVGTEDDYHSEEVHAFNSFLAGLSELGYGFAYRVFDAQYVRTQSHPRAVPQRRRRVFVVGYLGDWRRAAAVLFDAESLHRNPPPRREAGQNAAPTIAARTQGGGGLGTDFDCDGGLITSHDPACTLTARKRKGALPEADLSTAVAHALRGGGFDASEDGTGRGTPILPVSFSANDSLCDLSEGVCGTLRAGGKSGGPINHAVAIQERAVSESASSGPEGAGVRDDGAAYTLEARSTPQAVSFRTTGNDGAYETGDRIDALTTATDPNSHVLVFDTTQVTSPQNFSAPKKGDPCHPLAAGQHPPAVAFAQNQRGEQRTSTVAPQLTTGGGKPGGGYPAIAVGTPFSIMPMNSGKDYKARVTDVSQPLMAGGPVGGNQGGDFIARPWAVRRLTPRECDRLQGFTDDFTDIPWRGKETSPDGRRYKALGNSMAVNVMSLIGERIALVEALF